MAVARHASSLGCCLILYLLILLKPPPTCDKNVFPYSPCLVVRAAVWPPLPRATIFHAVLTCPKPNSSSTIKPKQPARLRYASRTPTSHLLELPSFLALLHAQDICCIAVFHSEGASLLLAGDVQQNPGPLCSSCSSNVKRSQPSILCSACSLIFHLSCSQFSAAPVHASLWICPFCTQRNCSTAALSLSSNSSTSSDLSAISTNVKPNSVNIYYANVRSIVNKLREFHVTIECRAPDIILLTETWLRAEISDDEILSSEYNIFRCDRPSRGCGLLIASRKCFNSSLVSVIQEPEFQILAVKCHLKNNKSLLLITLYRPHDIASETPLLLPALAGLHDVVNAHDYVCFAGDFNLKAFWDSSHCFRALDGNSAALDIIAELESLGLKQIVDFPSRGTNFLDLLWVNRDNLFSNIENIANLQKCDHVAISVDMQIDKLSRKVPASSYLKLKDADAPYLADLWDNAPWDIFLDFGQNINASIDDTWSNFLDLFWPAVHAAIPVIKLRRKHKRPAWISSEIIHLSNKKRTLYKKMLASSSSRISKRYRLLSDTIRDKTRISFRAHLLTLQAKRYTNPKAFWSVIKTKHNAAPPSAFKVNNALLTSPTDICNGFAHAFNRSAGISPLPTKQAPHFSSVDLPRLLTSTFEVTKIIKSLPNSSAPGPDHISADLLKLAPESIARPLAMLFNLSFARAEIPVQWKLANVIPLYKRSGPRDLINNYRPISLLSTVSKIMEKIIFTRMNSFAHDAQLIPPNQFGFRAGFSCTTLGVQAFHDWAKNLDRRAPTDTHVIFLDWSRAFDFVQHSLLLTKLTNFGFDPSLINWLYNYFCDRSQQICFAGCTSCKLPLLIGVPQGALLSSLLFNLFTADLPEVVANSSIKSYADDSFIYKAISSHDDSHLLQSDLLAIQKWGVANGLALNHAKCVYMVITRRLSNSNASYALNGIPLTRVYSHKSLGVIFQSNLKWSLHVNYICAKGRRLNALIHRTVGKAPIALDFYRAYTLPLLEFSSPIWQLHLQKDLSKIESVQRRFSRIFLGLKPSRRSDSEPSYAERLHLLHLSSLQDRRRSASLVLLHKFINGSNPIPLSNYLVFNTYKGGRCFNIPFARCDAYFNSFFLSTAKLWNSLKPTTREIIAISSFKNSLACDF